MKLCVNCTYLHLLFNKGSCNTHWDIMMVGHHSVLHVVVWVITVFQLRLAWNVSVTSVVPRLRFMNLVRNVFKLERDQKEWETVPHNKFACLVCSICLWYTVLFSVLLLCLVTRASFLGEGALKLSNWTTRARRTKKLSKDEFTRRISIFWLSIEVTEVIFRNQLKEAAQTTPQLRRLSLRVHGLRRHIGS